MRMVKHKEKKSHLNVSDAIRQEWKTGDKNAMADLLCQENFDKDFDLLRLLFKRVCFELDTPVVRYVIVYQNIIP